MVVRQNPKLFPPVLDFFRTDFKAANFKLEAEKIPSEIFEKKSFVVQRKKVTKIQPTEIYLQTLPQKYFVKKSWKKKVREKYSFETQKLSLISDLKLRIRIHDKDADNNTILNVLF